MRRREGRGGVIVYKVSRGRGGSRQPKSSLVLTLDYKVCTCPSVIYTDIDVSENWNIEVWLSFFKCLLDFTDNYNCVSSHETQSDSESERDLTY